MTNCVRAATAATMSCCCGRGESSRPGPGRSGGAVSREPGRYGQRHLRVFVDCGDNRTSQFERRRPSALEYRGQHSGIDQEHAVVEPVSDAAGRRGGVAGQEAAKTVRGITGADVVSTSCEVSGDSITMYRTTVNIAFAIER